MDSKSDEKDVKEKDTETKQDDSSDGDATVVEMHKFFAECFFFLLLLLLFIRLKTYLY